MKTLLFLVCFFIISTASADMYCSNHLITPGDFQAKVLAACGEPVQKVTTYQTVKNFVSTIDPVIFTNEIQIDTWYYNFGTSRLQYVLIFENGILVSANTNGQYGY